MSPIHSTKMTNYRWVVCGMLFVATMINYMDRQVLSLTWADFIRPEFGWDDTDYANITGFFAFSYAACMLFAGRFIDAVGARKGYLWAVCIWSIGALLHAFCGVLTCGWLTGEWLVDFDDAKEMLHTYGIAGLQITTISVYLFSACRFILALGESGNFPAAISVTAAYFPKKDRAFVISLFNIGASVGALFAPVSIPVMARYFGWEMAYVVVGGLGYLWVLIWIFFYVEPEKNDFVNIAELNYIRQDDLENKETAKASLMRCLKFPKTWALIVGRFMTDGVWWFFLFWTPVYISDFYPYTSDSPMGMALIFVLYLVSMLSIAGGYLPTYLVSKRGMTPYEGRMKAMLLFALIQLVGFFSIPLGSLSPWLLVIVIGVQCASHQSWSANLYAMVGDFFPKNVIATVTGVSGMAGGLASYIIMRNSGFLFAYAEELGNDFNFVGYHGKQAAYMIMFCIFSVLYLIGWIIMKAIVPEQSVAEKKLFDN